MTRIPEESQKPEESQNPGTVPTETGPASVPTDILALTEQIREQNATIQREFSRLHARLDSDFTASQKVVPSIACVKYAQDAAVLAYLVAHWIDPDDRSKKMKQLGPYMLVGMQQEFNLVDEGLPDGALVNTLPETVRLSSYVTWVGGVSSVMAVRSLYHCRQNMRTAFGSELMVPSRAGQFSDSPLIAHDNLQVHVKYIQNAAVSAYLLARWTDPSDRSTHTKDLGLWKPIVTQEEFTLVDKGIPEGLSVKPLFTVRFTSNIAGVGEYTSDLMFKVDRSASQGATFTQTGTAFKGFFTFEDLSTGSSWGMIGTTDPGGCGAGLLNAQ
ncbi:hypothetical protein C8R45DRAFT_923724 [Mycena sanguinolenta]|nr:hypothetical protein C8R45DRAFT_923724 [Mycena sanguinolenta]